MKKILAFILSISITISLIGCSGNSSQKNNTDTVGNISELTENTPILSKTNLNFGMWTDVGNDPNNIWHSRSALAFDDEYIYYSQNSSIYKVRYDGTGNIKIYNSDDNAEFLNVYKNALYFTLAGSKNIDRKHTHYYKIVKLDLSTLKETTIIEDTYQGYSRGYSFSSMLVANGFLLYAIHSNTDVESRYATAINLETNEPYYLTSGNSYKDIRFSVDENKNFYIFMKNSTPETIIHRINVKNLYHDVKTGYAPMFNLETVEELSASQSYSSYIFAPNGYSTTFYHGSSYNNYLWDDVDLEKKEHWPKVNIEINKESPYYSLHAENNTRFAIGINLLILADDLIMDTTNLGDKNGKTKIYMCEDFDTDNPKEVAKLDEINKILFNGTNNRFGVYKDSFYTIEGEKDNIYICKISSNGNLTKTKITK